MRALFAQFNGIEIFFAICAIIGGCFVLIRFVTQIIGFGHHGDMDSGVDSGNLDAHHADSDIGFKVLSLHGITSFLMMFGLVGLALYRQSGFGTLVSMVGALAAGYGSVWIIGKLFRMISKLQSSGTLTVDKAVGAEGRVYLKIPENGTGTVLVNVHNRLREYSAKAMDDIEIASDTPVRVVWVDGNLVVVEKI